MSVAPLSERYACLVCQVDWIDRTASCWSCGAKGIAYAHLVTLGQASGWHPANGFRWNPNEGAEEED